MTRKQAISSRFIATNPFERRIDDIFPAIEESVSIDVYRTAVVRPAEPIVRESVSMRPPFYCR